MKITLMRSGAIDCLPDCVEWIALEGKFDGHTPKQFREALALAKSAHPPILISSGGGDVDAAMAIGRIIRARGLDVIVTRAEALAPDPAAAPAADNRGISAKPQAVVDYGRPVLKGAFCASACTLVLASGVRRVVAPGVGVGVHEMLVPEQDQLQRVRYYQTRTLARGGRVVSKETRVVGERAFTRHIPRHDARADDYKRVLAYLGEMGLPAGEILKVMKTAAPEGMSWLSRPSLERTTLLATDSATPQVFLGLEKRAVAKTAAEPAPASASSERAVARNAGFGVFRKGCRPQFCRPVRQERRRHAGLDHAPCSHRSGDVRRDCDFASARDAAQRSAARAARSAARSVRRGRDPAPHFTAESRLSIVPPSARVALGGLLRHASGRGANRSCRV
jgi:hypothetical protein